MELEKDKLPKFVNDRFSEKKFYLSANSHNVFTLKEYRNGIKAAEMTLNKEQAATLMERMKNNGWYEV